MKQFLSLILYLSFIVNVLSQNQLGNDIDGEAASDFFGWSTAISSNGNRVIIGSRNNDEVSSQAGHVRVYEWNGTTWQQLGGDIDGVGEDDRFGHSVTMSPDGNRIVIGAIQTFASAQGYVKVFDWNGSAWIQVGATLVGEANNDQFGNAIGLSDNGNRLVVSSPTNDTNGGNSGQVEVFEWNGTNWQQIGQNINGTQAGSTLGISVDITNNGNTIAIGAEEIALKGSMRVFDFNGTNWVLRGNAVEGESNGSFFGSSSAMDSSGNRFVAGALWYSGPASQSGYARVYDWNGTSWEQLGNSIDGQDFEDQMGSSVDISGNGERITVGARFEDASVGNVAGVSRIFDWSGTAWQLVGSTIEAEAGGDASGHSLALSKNGERVIIGATNNDGNGSGAGHARVFQLETLSQPEFSVNQIVVFPNPVSSLLHFKNLDEAIIEVFNIFGQSVFQRVIHNGNIDIGGLASGYYTLKIETADTTYFKKIMKK